MQAATSIAALKAILDQLQAKIAQLLTKLTPEVIASITGYPFILNALSALNPIFYSIALSLST